MVDVDAGAVGARARRRTWMLGGGLLAASALLGLAAPSLSSLPGLPYLSLPTLLFSGGAIVFAVGLGRSGSVTARRPFGTGALVALAIWFLVQPLVLLPLPEDEAALPDFVAAMSMIGITLEVIALVLAVTAVTQIGRSGVVPRPWNWAPLWALLATVVAWLLQSGLVLGPGIADDQGVLLAVFGLSGILEAGAVAFLGVLAMILAVRPAGGATVVYSSAE